MTPFSFDANSNFCGEARSRSRARRLLTLLSNGGQPIETLDVFILSPRPIKWLPVRASLAWRRGWVFEVSFAEALTLLLRGPAPSYAPHAGETFPPRTLLFESHPLSVVLRGDGLLEGLGNRGDGLLDGLGKLSRQAVGLAERVGFEPTVELPRQQFSRLPDSAALAPLRYDRSSAGLILEQMRRTCSMGVPSLPWSMQFCNGLT